MTINLSSPFRQTTGGPENRWYPVVSKWWSPDVWLTGQINGFGFSTVPTPGWLTTEAHSPKQFKQWDWSRGQSDLLGMNQPSCRAHDSNRKRLGEGTLHIKGHSIAHDVIARPGQLMGGRFDRDDRIALSLFTLIETLNVRIVARGKMRRFHKRPS